MELSFVLSSFLMFFILYYNLKNFHTMRFNKYISTVGVIVLAMILAFLNQLYIPLLNLFGGLFLYAFLSTFFFEHRSFKSYIPDITIFVFLTISDGLIFYIVTSLFVFSGPNAMVMLICSTSLLIFIVNMLFGKALKTKNFFSVPLKEVAIFFLLALFHLAIVFLIDQYYVNNTTLISQNVTVFVLVGIVFTDVVVFRYLDELSGRFEHEKENMINENRNLLREQHYNDILKKYHEQRKLAHDFNNYLHVIASAYEQGNKEAADEIINDIRLKSSQNVMQYRFPSEILNIILTDKSRIAKEKNINFEVRVEPTDISFISDVHLISLLGNILDNAIEANENNEGEASILFELKRVNEMIVISCKNTYVNNVNFVNGKLISSKGKYRGLGTENIQQIAENYNGFSEYNADDCYFTTSVLLSI